MPPCGSRWLRHRSEGRSCAVGSAGPGRRACPRPTRPDRRVDAVRSRIWRPGLPLASADAVDRGGDGQRRQRPRLRARLRKRRIGRHDTPSRTRSVSIEVLQAVSSSEARALLHGNSALNASTTSGSNCVPEQRSSSVERPEVREAAAVDAVRGHGVVRVGDEEDSRPEWDLVAPRAGRVAGAVPPLVVVQHPVSDGLHPERVEHPEADLRVALEDEALRLGQRARACAGSPRGWRACRRRAGCPRAGAARSPRARGPSLIATRAASSPTTDEWLPV